MGSWTWPSTVLVTTCGLPDGQLEALAAHLLHEDRERELAAALDLPRVGTVRREDADGHVADELAVEAVLDLARGDLAALGRGRRAGTC